MIVRDAALSWDNVDNCRTLKADLFRDGFASISRITDPSDIEYIRTEILPLLSDRGVQDHNVRNIGDVATDAGTILVIVSPSTLRPRLLQSLFFQRALQISRAVLGSSARLRFDLFITKPPRNTAATDWHQDGAYQRLTRSPRRLHWWLPLQAVNMDNGCMHFVPRSHLGPILPHMPRSPAAHALKTDMPANTVPVACPLDVGGVTIHLPKTLHYAGPNNSDTPRHAWAAQIGIWNWVPTILH